MKSETSTPPLKSKRDITNVPNAKKDVPEIVNTLIIGSIALDSISKISEPLKLHDSNPGSTSSSLGGVAYNVSNACNLGLQSPSCETGNITTSRLVTIISDDLAGKAVIEQLLERNIDTSGILIGSQDAGNTAQYTSIHTGNGDLVVACADMSIVEHESFTAHILKQIDRSQPKQIVIDCNLSPKCTSSIFEYLRDGNLGSKVIIEPTSGPKSKRIGQIHSNGLQTFPNNAILLVTPTITELDQIHESFSNRGLFDDYDHWFPLLDSLGVDSTFRSKLEVSKEHVIKDGLKLGYLQQAFQILPYIPNILLKLGSKGVLSLTLSTSVEDYKSLPTTSKYLPLFIVTTLNGRIVDDSQKRLGISIQYFPIPSENKDIEIENVTGAGDSFLGYLVSRLLASNLQLDEGTFLDPEIGSVEQEWFKWESIYKAQVAAGESIRCMESISEDIKNI